MQLSSSLSAVYLATLPGDLVTGPGSFAGETTSASRWQRLRYRILSGTWLPNADPVKAWDVRNIKTLVQGLPRDAAVLDCGAYCSPALHGLMALGFNNLHGIDLNSHLFFLPSAARVCYSVQDMQSTAFADETFDFVYSASVIEHGVSWPRFLAEARRLLKPNGLFYLSTDLVLDDADTRNARAFGLPWQPLRVSEIGDACRRLSEAGFVTPRPPQMRLEERFPCRFLGIPHGFIAFACLAR